MSMETRKINKKVDSGGHFQVTFMKGEEMLNINSLV